MLPEPTLALTLPSIHDGLTLDCRVYHPFSLAANPNAPPWQRHAAIVAHPYAPLGGSYDDVVVGVVAETLLRKGYLVGTFNFRGGGSSAGRTSWTAKPERDDYSTFAAFLVYYAHHLDPFRLVPQEAPPPVDPFRLNPNEPPQSPKGPPDEATEAPMPSVRPVILLGGYSYGAMITARLPPLDHILQPFLRPEIGSDAAEVRLRAEHLAAQQNVVLASARAAMLERSGGGGSSRGLNRRSVRVGGDESGSPRRSHDSHGRRSFSLDAKDKIRHEVHEFMTKARHGRHGHRLFHAPDREGGEAVPELPRRDQQLAPAADMAVPAAAYLMISPLQGIVTHLATMSLVPSSMAKSKDAQAEAAEEKLVCNPSLAVFGDTDVFVAASKLRAWADRLQGKRDTQFKAHEVTTAGHFWAEEGVMDQMRGFVDGFAGGLLAGA